MQLRPEANPALTGPQSVRHGEVVVRDGGTPHDLGTFAEHGLFQGWGERTQQLSVQHAFLIRGSDDLMLNKPLLDSLQTVNAAAEPIEEVRAAPIEVWEGEVKSVDYAANKMDVYLRSKLIHAPDHAGEISLEWVPEQDADLVRPGAVFYWTLYKETRRGSIRNSQEVRFRRLPNWSRRQLAEIRAKSPTLFAGAKEPHVLADPDS